MDPMERDEALAMRLIANGIGTHPLKEHKHYDEAIVSFPLGTLDEAWVFLRRGKKTRRQFRFRIVPSSTFDLGPGTLDPGSETGEEPPRDVRLAMAERFLCDTLEIIRELPGSLQRTTLARALNHLVVSGQLDEEGVQLLRAFVRAWPATAACEAAVPRKRSRRGDETRK